MNCPLSSAILSRPLITPSPLRPCPTHFNHHNSSVALHPLLNPLSPQAQLRLLIASQRVTEQRQGACQWLPRREHCIAVFIVNRECQVMPADAVYRHPFERSEQGQQQQQLPLNSTSVSSRPPTSHGSEPNATDWRLLALSATRSKQQQQQQSLSAANLNAQRSCSALNPLSNSRDLHNTLSAAAAAAGVTAAALDSSRMQGQHNTPRVAAGWTVAEIYNIKVLRRCCVMCDV